MNKRLLRNFDFWLVAAVFLLSCVSLVMIASSSRAALPASADPLSYVKRQAAWFLLGLVLFLIVCSIEYSDFVRFARVIYIVNLGLLVAVLFRGRVVLGAQRWIGPLQPSEIAKISIIITLAALLAERDRVKNFKHMIPAFFHVAVPMVLILRQPDLGTSLVFLAIMFGMLFMAGAPSRYILGMVFGGLSAAVLAITLHVKYGIWLPLKDYQVKRLIVFINPQIDPLRSGYHVIQSKIAIGAGGLWGKGLFRGTQNRLNFLPEQHTDFIFSVIGEEVGFVGCLVVLALYFIVLWRGIVIMSCSRDQLGCLLAAGIVSMFAFHVLVNIGMTMGVMPITGIPLPFMSYGGNSFITNAVAIGILESISMRRQKIMF